MCCCEHTGCCLRKARYRLITWLNHAVILKPMDLSEKLFRCASTARSIPPLLEALSDVTSFRSGLFRCPVSTTFQDHRHEIAREPCSMEETRGKSIVAGSTVHCHEGSIPFTRSTDYQGFSKQCSKLS